jgi:putative hydrolase of the HAD superfamily
LVTFDLWETLIFDPPEYPPRRREARLALIRKALGEFGYALDAGQLGLAYDSSWGRIKASWHNHDDMDIPEQVRTWMATLNGSGIQLDAEQIALLSRLYVQPFCDLGAEILSGAIDTVRAAHDAGFTVGLISNTGRTPGWALRECMARLGLLSFFDFTVFSNEELVRKPSPEIFRRAAARAGVSTGWHIGDSYEFDVTGAAAAGWTPIWIAGSPLSSEPVSPNATPLVTELEIWPDIASGCDWFAGLRVKSN